MYRSDKVPKEIVQKVKSCKPGAGKGALKKAADCLENIKLPTAAAEACFTKFLLFSIFYKYLEVEEFELMDII